MHSGQRKSIEQFYKAETWYGRVGKSQRVLKGFNFTGSEIRGWTLERSRREESGNVVITRSMWRRGESTNEVLAVDVFECASVKAAHDQVIEALGNMESNAIKRQSRSNTVGDVHFTLDDTMSLFARANVVTLIRNAGPVVVKVSAIARQVDSLILRLLKFTGKQR